MSGTDNASAFISELIQIVMEGDLFTEQEARALLRSVTAEKPEEIPLNVEKVVDWARKVRTESAALEVILKLGEHRAIDVRPAEDGGVVMRLNMSPDEIEIS